MTEEALFFYGVIAGAIVLAGVIGLLVRSRRREEQLASAAAARGWKYAKLAGGTFRLEGTLHTGQPWLVETLGGKAPWTVWRCEKFAASEGSILIGPRRKAFGIDLGDSLTKVLVMSLMIPVEDFKNNPWINIKEVNIGGETFQKYFRVNASDMEAARNLLTSGMEALSVPMLKVSRVPE